MLTLRGCSPIQGWWPALVRARNTSFRIAAVSVRKGYRRRARWNPACKERRWVLGSAPIFVEEMTDQSMCRSEIAHKANLVLSSSEAGERALQNTIRRRNRLQRSVLACLGACAARVAISALREGPLYRCRCRRRFRQSPARQHAHPPSYGGASPRSGHRRLRPTHWCRTGLRRPIAIPAGRHRTRALPGLLTADPLTTRIARLLGDLCIGSP